MKSRQQLAALINILSNNLNSYINSLVWVQAPNGEWKIDVIPGKCKELTTARANNIFSIRKYLETQLDVLQTDKDPQDDAYFNKTLNEIRNKLQAGLEQNSKLSSEYGRIHSTYRENRLINLGFFSSLWNKTLFQSRATRVLEKSLADIEIFETKFLKKNEYKVY